VSRATDAAYLVEQYSDAEKIRIRQQAHELFSERPNECFFEFILSQLELSPGSRVLDIGCGNGAYHGLLARVGASVIAADLSLGMLREVQAQASRLRLALSAVAADAADLPLVARSCDAVMANHMMYHVSDPLKALREIHRVLVAGGRVVLSTNAQDFARELYEIHEQAARSLGLEAETRAFAGFTLDHLELVQRVFPNAQVKRCENAFLFPTAEAALRYYASGVVDLVAGGPLDRERRDRLLRSVEERIRSEIDSRGSFRVTKTTGCFVGTK
jgi:SAM-dependent methyltransferase